MRSVSRHIVIYNLLINLFILFILNTSIIWSFCFFFLLTYLILLFSALIYLLPITLTKLNLKVTTKIQSTFYIISGSEMYLFFLTPCLIIFFISFLWSSMDLTVWFGHLVFSTFQLKVFYFVLFIFFLVLYITTSVTYYSSNEIYDFTITQFNFLYWLLLLFMTNSTFTLMFLIEVTSSLLFLLITSSVFSTSFFYKNVNFELTNFFSQLTPFSFLQSLLYFFWISLVSSLNLFVFLVYFYQHLVTFDWFFLEHIFLYLTLTCDGRGLTSIGFAWFFIMFSIFLKCGVSPLFLWKPTFFKGLSLLTLIFYISFFYFHIFLFLILFLTTYMHSIFYYYFILNLLIIGLGLLGLFFILCEAFYLKTFIAVSSILNSLFVFLSITTYHSVDMYLLF